MKKIWLILIGIALSFGVAAADFKEGKQYLKLEKPQLEDTHEIVEFFSFYCPACYQFEVVGQISKRIKEAVADKGIIYKKYHVDFLGGEMGVKMTQAWAVALALKVDDKVKGPLFEGIQRSRSIHSEKDIRDIFVKAGVTEEEFDKAWNSFSVKTLVLKQKKAVIDYQLRAVPSIYANGMYLVNNSEVSSFEEFANVAIYLATKDN